MSSKIYDTEAEARGEMENILWKKKMYASAIERLENEVKRYAIRGIDMFASSEQTLKTYLAALLVFDKILLNIEQQYPSLQ